MKYQCSSFGGSCIGFRGDPLPARLPTGFKAPTGAKTQSGTLDTLISWLEHDVLNKAGPTKNQRRELYDFVVEEFKKLEVIEPHRISVMRITLENKRDAALGFVDVLEVKFAAIGNQFSISMESAWSMCVLQRCHAMEYQYGLRSELLEADTATASMRLKMR